VLTYANIFNEISKSIVSWTVEVYAHRIWSTSWVVALQTNFNLFWYYFYFLSIYISIIYLTKKVVYGGRISKYSPDHGRVSCSLILMVASMTVEVGPIDPHGLWSWPMQYVWTSYLNEYSKYLGLKLV
jgi:hypothetical protein